MSRFSEIVLYHCFFRRHVCLSNLKHAPSRELRLTARKTVISPINAPFLTSLFVISKVPEDWHEVNLTDPNQPNHFGKNKQSPIHIKTSEVEEASYHPLKITFYKTRGLVTGTLKNNWHLTKVEPADSYGASLTGGPLGDNTFELLQFHVHFGCTNDRGSEHKLDGTQLSGQVNVTAMLAFFLLHLTYRHFSFLISWPAEYLCLEKRFQ